MNARRVPFQFSTSDPLARQRELEKRFGLQPTCPKMYVDVNCPSSMDNIPKETSSPRLQHRVPIFAEGYVHPIHSSSVDSMATVPDKKPNVRVIPIEIEGADDKLQRHRTYSGPAGSLKDNLSSPFKRFHYDNLSRSSKPNPNVEPRVFNIPIQIEGANKVATSPKVVASKHKSTTQNANECSLPKQSSKVKYSKAEVAVSSKPDVKENDQSENVNVEILLKKIEDILTEFKSYETGVLEFNGTSKDKQYRYLDEMLTRCMLRLDDIVTMGNEEVRLSRKNAVKKIQASIDLLESKANAESVEVSQVQTTAGENSVVDENSYNDIEMQDNQVKGNIVESPENKASTFELKEIESVIDKDLNEVSESIVDNDGESNSVVKSTEISEVEDNNVILSEENLTSSLQQQPIMSEETSLSEVSSSNDVRSVEKSIEQDGISSKAIMDEVEMLDEKAENKSDTNKSNGVSEVEMVEIDDFKGPREKIECETVERVANCDSDCFEQKTDCSTDVSTVQDVCVRFPQDVEMEDIQSASDDIVHSETSDLCVGQNVKCVSNQSEKADVLQIVEEN